MCQIISKPGSLELPFNLLKATCGVNQHGWGVMFLDPGNKAKMHREYHGSNDPEKIAKKLEEYADIDNIVMHFRFRTRGKIDTDSCHPFKLGSGDNPLYLMHNGTIPNYGDEHIVDSEDFGKKYVLPIYSTFKKAGEDPLTNQFFKMIIEDKISRGNKIVLLDNTGSLILNKEAGEVLEEKGEKYWVSNTYSFNSGHRDNWYDSQYDRSYTGTTHHFGVKPVSTVPTTTVVRQTYTRPDVAKDLEAGTTVQFNSLIANTVNKTVYGIIKTIDDYGITLSGSSVKYYYRNIENLIIVEEVLEVCKELGMENLEDCQFLTPTELQELVEDHPEKAVLLIETLIDELWGK